MGEEKVGNKLSSGSDYIIHFSPTGGVFLSILALGDSDGRLSIGMSTEVSGGASKDSPLAARGVLSSLATCPPSLRTSPSTESIVAAREDPLLLVPLHQVCCPGPLL
ncbi:UNVERIFIED_CONTAM: hypothetical protein Slati_3111600 [Sesamum latifolium]|uniref:Uncharacterized protein n=1 Tax=Sesamum latifolium TaxID=2727402 RepID=A0AAW2UWQ8_9LAMI